jgi:hypothetical protein
VSAESLASSSGDESTPPASRAKSLSPFRPSS